MKKITLLFVFSFLVANSIFAEDLSGLVNFISSYPIFTAVIVIAHICLTVAVYKMKGGPWACFYFFLAPLVILLLLFAIDSSSKGKSNR
ncbi:MAG: hypothetical protein LBC76_02255 [Treponema sp.]|jgi:hypothetical protein|nr:hypothetical protein [Treponema sp.]